VLKELKIEVYKPIALFIDNKFSIDLAKNPVMHRRSKVPLYQRTSEWIGSQSHTLLN